ISTIAVFLCFMAISIFLSSCNDNNILDPSAQTDDEYLKSTALNTAFSSNSDDDDNLFASEIDDFDSQGPVSPNSPIDSLVRWGRRITNVNTNSIITTIGDTIKNVEVTRTISGNFIIVGYVNGLLDSTIKPYMQEQKRFISFKRVDRRPNPKFNWRVYQFSAVDGETKTPQMGKANIVMNKIEFYKNNILILTLNGPDFTTNIFTSRFFGNNGAMELNRGDVLSTKVYLKSNQNDTDIVAFHWARNAFGFHRESFIMTSQVPNGSEFDRTYEKTFEIYNQHNWGSHNAFISANTRSSLYDNSPSLFSSTYMGLPFKVRR
ncbi:MAG: hypothetical protein M3P82_05510, partial [Bacteroidota bacterium]|nr:hypothetical protein [Bacteroidota bacterium]